MLRVENRLTRYRCIQSGQRQRRVAAAIGEHEIGLGQLHRRDRKPVSVSQRGAHDVVIELPVTEVTTHFARQTRADMTA